jgi:hypothetical protein
MSTTTKNPISSDVLREALSGFWNEQLAIEESRGGLAAALPLMYPDGMQVTVNIEPFAPAQAMITDRGRTLMALEQGGINLEPRSKHNHALLEEKKKVFDLNQDGYELRKLIRLPLSGIDVQLFAESLVSISHLVYRAEAHGVQEHVVRNALQRTFETKHLKPKENAFLPRKVVDRIPVGFLFEEKRVMAMKPIDIHGRVRDHMEQWGWRWTDLHKQNPDVLRAMIYNPDQQDWDETSLKIGREVCDLFCPYFESGQISDALTALHAA